MHSSLLSPFEWAPTRRRRRSSLLPAMRLRARSEQVQRHCCRRRQTTKVAAGFGKDMEKMLC
ncbi:uncharacterized protein PODANS_4_5880 [Podospora anserina S mat+]|uniref:Podospora anserina S mat+ genomic DNA chromosome 4, supercontig 4 n=1 Tax=Podospora anserina (strain S / ATCC MYA-4624 / DSM 980 / FGSC 10383) TaxID=515849 RepID=B2APY3_PODAN|nr:uncharacterized protein PODANS_4_5880 [Podospora anserina S mat+]CAP66922.1 unnamed protein product [Podospora anserina S mat+]CDP28664.1 Putative protein of unknown function [Podospora anserina S mat+]